MRWVNRWDIAIAFLALAVLSGSTPRRYAAAGEATPTGTQGASLLVRTVRVGAYPFALAVDAPDNRVFVVNRGARAGTKPGSVSILDATSGAVLHTVQLGVMRVEEFDLGPQAAAVDIRRGHAFVLVSGPPGNNGDPRGLGSVAMLDARTGRMLQTTRVGRDPIGVAADETTGRAFVLNQNPDNLPVGASDSGTVSVLDSATGRVLRTVVVGHSPVALALNPLTHRVFIPNGGLQGGSEFAVSVLDGTTGALLAHPRVPAWGCAVAVDAFANRALVNLNVATTDQTPPDVTLSILDGTTGAVRRDVALPDSAAACPFVPSIAVDQTTGRAVVARDQVYILATCSGRVVRAVTAQDASLTVDGRHGYAFGTEIPGFDPHRRGYLDAFDPTTGALLARVPVGRFPAAVAVDARSGRVFVANEYDNTVSVLQADLGRRTAPGQPTPASPVPAAGCGARYFPQTRHNLAGPLLAFWQRSGGLAVLGYPRSELFHQGTHLAQYTERFLLQLTNGRVTVAPLGRLLTQGRAFPRVAPFPSTSDRLYFPQTGHSLAGRFLAYWRAHHGAALLGAPLSEVVVEANGDGAGRRYPVQWFERGRLEYHAAAAGTPYAVQPGLLGVQALQACGWLPLAPE